DRAVERPARAARARPPCAPQRGRLDDHGSGRERGLSRRRDTGDRGCLCAAGGRAADDQLDQPARLPRRAGRHTRVRGHGRARLPADRPRACAPRPAREVRLAMAVAAEVFTEAQLVEHRRGFRRRWYRTPSFVAGVTILGVVVLAAIFAPFITQHNPTDQDLLHTLAGPSSSPWLGTAELGRDVWSRLAYGARTTLRVAFLAVIFPFTIGTVLGLAAGYYGGWIDTVTNWLVNVVVAFPFFVLIIALVYSLGPGTRSIYIAITLVGWVSYTRIIRGEVLVAKRRDYVLAARAAGLSDRRILFRHLLPNVVTQAIVFACSDIILDILA